MSSAAVGFITFIIGIIVGVVGQKLFANSSAQQSEQQKIDSEKALADYKQEVASHLEKSTELLEQMNETCQVAMQQMAESTKLLQQATPTDAQKTHMPFFAEETHKELAETAELRHERRKSPRRESDQDYSQPPLDYSGSASGLFVDKSQTVTNNQ